MRKVFPYIFFMVLGLFTDGSHAAPRLQVSPPAYDFGVIETGSTASLVFLLSNVGDELLRVNELEKTGSANFFVDEFSPEEACGANPELAPGELCGIAVNFSPSDSELFSATLNIVSNDPILPVAAVPLNGEGLGSDCSLGGGSPNHLIWWSIALLPLGWGRFISRRASTVPPARKN